MKGPTENPLGGGGEGDWEVEEPVEDPGPPGGREVWAGGTKLPLHHGCWKATTFPCVFSLVRVRPSSWDRPGRRAKGC